MEIPESVRILAPLQTGSVFYFEEDQLSSPEPHYFIVLNRNPHTEQFLILVVASSQVERRRKIVQDLGFSPETLVVVTPSEYPLFSKETAIDCNRTFEKTPQSLIEKLTDKKLGICTEIMSKEIMEKLVRGVLTSTQVSNEVKRMLGAE